MASSKDKLYSEAGHDDDEAYAEADDAAATAEDSERLQAMSQEERDHQRRDWLAELEKTEEEIQTLKQVLNSKIRRANDLKRRLGITVFGELRSDLKTSWLHLKESGTYQRTASAAKGAATRVSEKWSSVRNSNAFRSIGGRVGSAYTNVKARVAGSGPAGGVVGPAGSAEDQQQQQQQQRERLRQLAEAAGGFGETADEAAEEATAAAASSSKDSVKA